MTFDEQVTALKGRVIPAQSRKKKSDSTPEEWAACLAYYKAWRDTNPEKAAAWRKRNPAKVRAAAKKWNRANPEKRRAILRKCLRKRFQTDHAFRMMHNLRVRQRKFFKGKTRSLSMIRDMGCTQEFFRQHIESQLAGDMTMKNYGKVWHLDHIYPLAAADIVGNPVHFLAACNWRNLQPMLGPENEEKSDDVTPEAQVLFDSLVHEFTRKVVAACSH